MYGISFAIFILTHNNTFSDKILLFLKIEV